MLGLGAMRHHLGVQGDIVQDEFDIKINLSIQSLNALRTRSEGNVANTVARVCSCAKAASP